MATSTRKTRPARANSLQRMLELERRYMMERFQSSTVPSPTTKGIPSSVVSPPPGDPSMAKAHLAIQYQHTTGQGPRDARRDARSVPRAAAQAAPLTINVSVSKPKREVAARPVDSVSDGSSATEIHASPDKITSKIVSFDVPSNDEDQDDRRSICQSPSWEAYGRRKKEKTEEKKEQKRELRKEHKKDLKREPKDIKKEKELEKEKDKQRERERERAREKESEKQREKEKEKEREREREKQREREKEKDEADKAAMAKKKRLSKNPPTSSTHALDQANRMTRARPAVVQEKARPASAMDRSSPPRDDSRQRRSRSRSGSLSSLLRRPFESRRNSVDTNALEETGFIGGIKLEMERHAALQKALDEQQLKSEKEDEANIHPALRAGQPHETSHLEAPPSSGNKSPNAQRRAYPPITRLTSPGKTRSLVLPNSTSMPEVGSMEKWKAFVGIKSGVKQAVAEAANGVPGEDSKRPMTAGGNGKSASSMGKAPPQPPRTGNMDRLIAAASSSTSSPAASPSMSSPQTSSAAERPKTAVPSATCQPAARSESSDDQLDRPSIETLTPDEWVVRGKSVQDQLLMAEVERCLNDGLVPTVVEVQTNLAASKATKGPPLQPLDLETPHGALPGVLPGVPPEPPRRSPKRDSMQSLKGFVPPLTSSTDGPPPRSPRRPDSSSALGTRDENVPPDFISDPRFGSPKPPHACPPRPGSGRSSTDSLASGNNSQLGGSGVPLKAQRQSSPAHGIKGERPDNVKIPTWSEIKSTVMQTIEHNVSLSPVRKSQSFLRDDSDFTVRRLTDDSVPVTSSSDDLSSDEFHSPSMPGTPDTSRPQSEKGVPPLFTDIEQRLMSPGDMGLVSPKTTAKADSEAANGTTSFLPKLKHQPLKPADKQMAVASPMPSREKILANHRPWPASYLEEARKATPLAPPPRAVRSPQLTPKGTPTAGSSPPPPPSSIRSNNPSPASINRPPSSGTVTPGGDPIGKMFVECCGCKYYHDMPSNIYEVMANPEAVIPASRTKVELSGIISMTVRCPWCNHEMSTRCCAGYVAIVYVKQKLH